MIYVPANLVTDEKLDLAARTLHEARPNATIILFGSRARGDADEFSDVDFLLILPNPVRSIRHQMVELVDCLRPFRIAADVIVVGQEEFDKRSAVPGTLYHAARHEGRLLYGSI